MSHVVAAGVYPGVDRHVRGADRRALRHHPRHPRQPVGHPVDAGAPQRDGVVCTGVHLLCRPTPRFSGETTVLHLSVTFEKIVL